MRELTGEKSRTVDTQIETRLNKRCTMKSKSFQSKVMMLAWSALIGVGALTTSGCQSGGWFGQDAGVADIVSGSRGMSLLSGKWNVSKLGGEAVSSLLPGATGGGKMPFLQFARDGKVTGFSGVNTISSKIDAKQLLDGKFKLANVVSTRMAGTPEANAFEGKFFNALNRTTKASVKGNTLSLANSTGTVMELVKSR
jgi:heat shock protein HslJ